MLESPLKSENERGEHEKENPGRCWVSRRFPADLLTKSLHKGSRRIRGEEDPLTPAILKAHSCRAIFQKWTTIRTLSQ